GALPMRGEEGIGATEATTAFAATELTESATAALFEAASARGERIEEVLLTAVLSAVAEPTAAAAIAVELERHGRAAVPPIAPSRPVGWFSSVPPAVVSPIVPGDPESTLAAVRRAVRSVSGPGIEAIRGHVADREARDALVALPSPQLTFNYLGRFDVRTER